MGKSYVHCGSDNNAWHFNAMADYRFNDWGSAFVGYRYMKIDYASSSYSYDAKQQGPLLGDSIYL
jgi:predicted porin